MSLVGVQAGRLIGFYGIVLLSAARSCGNWRGGAGPYRTPYRNRDSICHTLPADAYLGGERWGTRHTLRDLL